VLRDSLRSLRLIRFRADEPAYLLLRNHPSRWANSRQFVRKPPGDCPASRHSILKAGGDVRALFKRSDDAGMDRIGGGELFCYEVARCYNRCSAKCRAVLPTDPHKEGREVRGSTIEQESKHDAL
jgi:hypothetical protein